MSSLTPHYEDAHATIYNGDCLQTLAALPFDSVDAIVTDPPYFLPAAHYSVRSGTFRSLGDLSMLEHMFASMPEAPNVKTGDGDILRGRAVPIGERNHLAEKPEEILTKLIAKTTPEDGVVLDPFAGSGSTLRAARFLGRRCIGIEVEPRYCEVIVSRLGQGILDLGAAA